MTVNLDFDICALIIIAIIVYLYYIQQSISTNITKIYWCMLFQCSINISLDIICTMIDESSLSVNRYLVYFLNGMYQETNILCLVLMTIYLYALANIYISKDKTIQVLILGPLLFQTYLIASSPFTHYIFYINEQGKYVRGFFHYSMYICFLYYIFLFLYAYVKHILKSPKTGKKALGLLLVILCVLIGVQYAKPNYMLIGFAMACGLFLLFHIFQKPSYYKDSLTQLFNRNAFMQIISEYFHKRKNCGIILIAIDNFKYINSLVGQKGGNEILVMGAKSILQDFSKDLCFRINGDQYCVVIRNIILDVKFMNQLNNRTKKTVIIEGIKLQITVTVLGYNLLEFKGVENLFSAMDYTMQYQKAHKKNHARLCDAKFIEKSFKKNKMENLLNNAIEYDFIQIYYQPIIGEEKKYAEALLRIYDPRYGYLNTEEVIKIAEENNTINILGEKVLEHVCKFLYNHDIRRYGFNHINVNLSVIQSIQYDLYDKITFLLKKYEIDPGLIMMEITETAAITSLDQLQQNMNKLNHYGIKFFLDDFGSGYSNMDYLFYLPLEAVKFDKNMVHSSYNNKKKTTMIKSLVQIVHDMDLKAVFEGVENVELEEFSKNLGADFIQGYLYSKPIDERDFWEYIQKDA